MPSCVSAVWSLTGFLIVREKEWKTLALQNQGGGGGDIKKKELCPLIALFINTHFVGHFEVLCSPCSRLAQSAVLY